jgi:gliding motility associated protien GldN
VAKHYDDLKHKQEQNMMNMIKEISETILKALCIVQFSLFTIHIADAQPAQRRNQAQQQGATARKNSTTLTTRAQISYPATMQMAEDVVWRRDIYRELDLMQGANSGMYYPVEPVGSQMNLLTYLFKLVLSGQVKAYKYNIDGNESFAADNQLKPLSLLDDYNIYYERKDGRLKLDNSDIPSREVKGYYIKESSYFDQNSATFHTKVIALCPIMFREDDFGDGVARYPLFWVKYDDVAPFLTKQTIMTSDINNAATMSMDDYFVKNMYRGKIYKTNNMLGQTLAQYCPTDSAMAKEQQRIEAELKAFEENIWATRLARIRSILLQR